MRSPGATSVEQFAELLNGNRDYVTEPIPERWPEELPRLFVDYSNQTRIHAKGGYIHSFSYDWRTNRIPPKQVENANPLQFMLLHAAGEALQQAKLFDDTGLLQRTAVVVGSIFGGEFSHQLQIGLRMRQALCELDKAAASLQVDQEQAAQIVSQFENQLVRSIPALSDETGSFTSSTLASRVTKHFNLMGGAFAMDAGDQSSARAIAVAIDMLRNKTMDVVLCASGNRAIDFYSYQRLFTERCLPGQQLSRDNHAPGEGVVAIALQRLDEARLQGRPILGIIEDVSFSRSPETTTTEPDRLLASLQSRIGKTWGLESMLGLAASIVKETASNDLPMTVNSCDVHSNVCSIRFTKGNKSMEPPASQFVSQSSMPTKNPQRTFQTAGCFPGQGSQGNALLQDPLLQTIESAEVLKLADKVLSGLKSRPFEKLVLEEQHPRREQIWSVQASMLIADVAIARTLLARYAQFDCLIGHSLGELAALVVAQAWSLEDALHFLRARADAVADATTDIDSCLLSLVGTPEVVQKLIGSSLNTLSITHRNAPNQTVVGGSIEDIAKFEGLCEQHNIACVRLRVPVAYHSPILEAARWQLLKHINELPILPPSIPVLSTVTNQFVSDPDSIRRNLVDQLVTPVDYQKNIEKLASCGISRFVEVGPGRVLTKLHKSVIASSQALTAEQYLNQADGQHLPRTAMVNGAVTLEKDDRERVSGTHKKRVLLDATTKRRAAMKQKSAEHAATAGSLHRQEPAPASTNGAISLAASTTGKSSSLDRVTLQQFIVDFIVEHTGYPREMIEPQWDLEADLGVDSIKQAQLYGELRQTFNLDPAKMRGIVVRSIDDICNAVMGSMTLQSELGNEEVSVELDLTTAEVNVVPLKVSNENPGVGLSVQQIPSAVASPQFSRPYSKSSSLISWWSIPATHAKWWT